jgi:hypothetical protein
MENINENLLNSNEAWESQCRSSLSKSLTRFRASTCSTERSSTSFRESLEGFNMRGSKGKITKTTENDESTSNTKSIEDIVESTQNDASFSLQNFNPRKSIQYGFRKNQNIHNRNLSEVVEKDEDDETNITKLKVQNLVTEKYKYVGQTLNDKKQGFGICYYQNGDKYIGNFQEDRKQGWGKYFVKATGKQFYGEFVNNQIDGFVEYTNKQGLTHHGYMKNHKFVNKEAMRISFKEKYQFEGIMEFDAETNKLNGIATIRYQNGNIYQGETIESCENGWGILKRSDGYTFNGIKVDNKFNGYCEIEYPDKSMYFGQFHDNKRNGLGICLSNEGLYCIGEFKNDLKDGAFLTINKENSVKFELHLLGFMTKTIDKKEYMESYTHMVYPEFEYLTKINHQYLTQKLSFSQ